MEQLTAILVGYAFLASGFAAVGLGMKLYDAWYLRKRRGRQRLVAA